MQEIKKSLIELYSSKEIEARVNDMGKDISIHFSTSNPIFIGVLNGSFIFMADLLRSLSIDCEIDFIKVRSYSGKRSSGTIHLLKDISSDIIDSGLTIKFIYDRILGASPRSITVVTFLHKTGLAKLDFPIDFIGFEIPHKFVVGYGLDYNQKMRHLGGLYHLPDDLNIER